MNRLFGGHRKKISGDKKTNNRLPPAISDHKERQKR
jgi:hypothetical protein